MRNKWTDFSHSGSLSSLASKDTPQLCGYMGLHVHIGTAYDSQNQNDLFDKLQTQFGWTA